MQVLITLCVVATISRGPYLSWQSSPESTMTVAQKTTTKDSSKVAYGIGKGYTSATDSFKTLPSGIKPMHFVVFGDMRTADSLNLQSTERRMVVDSIIGHNPEWGICDGNMVHSGDRTPLLLRKQCKIMLANQDIPTKST